MNIDLSLFNSQTELRDGLTQNQLKVELAQRNLSLTGANKDVLAKRLWPAIWKDRLNAIPLAEVGDLSSKFS
jgi:hypothetical protein